MIILAKIFCFMAVLYALLITINNLVLPDGWRTNGVEIICCLIAAFVFGVLCVVL